MEQIRVLLIDMAHMTRAFIRDELVKADDVAVVGELAPDAPLIDAVDSRRADVVIFGTQNARLPRSCLDLLHERPRAKVLTIERNGRAAFRYDLRVEPLGQVSPRDLLEAVRRAVSTT